MESGKVISIGQLSDIFLELQAQNANNINLVTPSHYVLQIREALLLAKKKGLTVPIVYNCGGYESVEALQALDGLIDIYLTDFKYRLLPCKSVLAGRRLPGNSKTGAGGNGASDRRGCIR